MTTWGGDHDPVQVAVGRVALERGLLDRGRALAALQRATQESVSLREALRREGWSDERLDRELRAIEAHLTGRRASGLYPSIASAPAAAPAPAPAPSHAPAPSSGPSGRPGGRSTGKLLPRPRRLAPGDRIAGHTIERILGQGAMGAVFLGKNDAGARHAIKVPFLAEDDQIERARFEREALSLARLRPHRNVVRVHAAGFDADQVYCVLELVEGQSLDKVLKAGVLPWKRALQVAEQVALGLAHVHAAGIFHRDVKPANILVRDEDGSAVLSDFGLARDASARERLTQTGVMVGTPLYMPPEQVKVERPADARSDVYSLGATLYHLLAGRVPIIATTLEDLVQKLASERPAPPSTLVPGLPAAVDAIVLRALEKRPEDRYPSASDFAADLARARAGGPVTARVPGARERLAREVSRNPRRLAKVLALGVAALGIVNLVLLAVRSFKEPAACPPGAPSSPSREARHRHDQWRQAIDEGLESLEAARRKLELARVGLARTPDETATNVRAFETALGRVEALLSVEAPDPLDGAATRAELAPRIADGLADLAVLEVASALASHDGEGAAAALERALACGPPSERASVELALAGVNVGIERHSSAILRSLPRAPALAGLRLSAATRDASVGDLALGLASELEPRVSAAARSALAIARARAYGAVDATSFGGKVPELVTLLREVGEGDPLVAGSALAGFLREAGQGAGATALAVSDRLPPPVRANLAKALAALDRCDPDAVEGLELPAPLGNFFVQLGSAEGLSKDFDTLCRLDACALRASPETAAALETRVADLKLELDHVVGERQDLEAGVDLLVDAVRSGYVLLWPHDRAMDEPRVILERRLAALPAGARPDWALAFALADELENAADDASGAEKKAALAGRSVDLAQKVGRDPHATRSVRSRALAMAGRLLSSPLCRPDEALVALRAAHDDSPYPEIQSASISTLLLEAWVRGGRKDAAVLDEAIASGRRAADEARLHLDATDRSELCSLTPGGVPLFRLEPIEEDSCRSRHLPLVRALIAKRSFAEAEPLLGRVATGTVPYWEGHVRAQLLAASGRAGELRPCLEAVLADKEVRYSRAQRLGQLRRGAQQLRDWGFEAEGRAFDEQLAAASVARPGQ